VKKVLLMAVTAMGVTAMLVYVALILKLMALGEQPFSGDIGPVWLPFGHIEVSSSGFSVENKLGSVVVPVLVGVVVAVAGWWRQRRRMQVN
jgi:hypothetical protein